MKSLDDMHDTITYLQRTLYDQYAKKMSAYEQFFYSGKAAAFPPSLPLR